MMKKFLSTLLLTTFLFSASAINAGAQTSANPSHLLVLGDSIATGYGLADGQNNYGSQLAKAFNLTGTAYTNLAVDGASSGNLLTALTTNTPATLAPAITSADTIVLSIGGNDVLSSFIVDLKTALGLQSTATNAQLEAAITANPTASTTAITTAMSNAQVQAQFATAVQTFTTNFTSIIGTIRHANPTARLYVQTIYNPFSGLTGYDTLSAEAETIIGRLNNVITQGAAAGNYTALDIHGAFAGKALQYTNMAQFDIHPNEAGHTAIFNAAYTAITGKAYTAPTSSSSIGVTYVSQVQHIGWQKFANDGVLSGTTGKSLRDEAVQIKLTGDFPAGASIIYQAYVQKLAWLQKVSDGQTAGTTGKALRLEALRITLSGLTGYEVQYRVHVQGIGWQAWKATTNGTDISAAVIAGTIGQSRRIEAIKIRIVKIAG